MNLPQKKSNALNVEITLTGPDKDDYYQASVIGAKGELSAISRGPNIAIAYVLEMLSKEYLVKLT